MWMSRLRAPLQNEDTHLRLAIATKENDRSELYFEKSLQQYNINYVGLKLRDFLDLLRFTKISTFPDDRLELLPSVL